ncbi:DUF2634 domain-containing protein [Alkaliphilus peptidifermentans]|uniref:DUF2634 domain-containing protein n=1 Tax=Alkaliphilus peptidifermentans DSM 18978 TaxID=1120976 RepID=A0A1G5JXA4_9FIRM|nr:DUF2634 domain-containing protein [Alkaliphilus peptidifermentans]SCY92956.1 Protein of unknown function [Alkaliphilus peptidifermentans DSM 18978]
MLPKIGYLQIEKEEGQQDLQLGKSFLFDFKKGDFILKDGKLVEINNIEALKIWIEKVLRTDRNKYKIYTSQYGISIEDLIIGQNLPIEFIKSEVKREVSEALLKHPLINNISNWHLEKDGSNLTISFKVNNSITQEVILGV